MESIFLDTHFDYTRTISQEYTRLWVFGHQCHHNLQFQHNYTYNQLTHVLDRCVYAVHSLTVNTQEDYDSVCADAGCIIEYAVYKPWAHLNKLELYTLALSFDWTAFESADILRADAYVDRMWSTHFDGICTLPFFKQQLLERL